MLVMVLRKTLNLKHAFTISRGTKTDVENVIVNLEHNGLSGWGEASANDRYNESPETTINALAAMIDALSGPCDDKQIKELLALVPGQYAAQAAMEMALLDYRGKQLKLPLYQHWGLDPKDMAPTSMTIAMAEPQQMAIHAREASDFKILKIKLGASNDRAMIQAIRAVTDQKLRVDANEGWLDREAAAREIDWLATQGVELVEQPMPAAQLEDAIWLKSRSILPLIADEAFTTPDSINTLQDGYHGINVKLQKCGGILAARQSIEQARAQKMSVMLGCMVESSLGISAAAHLAPLADYLDLDGHLLVTNDPFDGLEMREGYLHFNNKFGLGVTPNQEIMRPEDCPTSKDEDMLEEFS